MSVAPPLIDVAGLRSPKLSDRLAVAGAIGNACRGIGFFYVLGHALDTTLMDAMFDATRRFFALALNITRAGARSSRGQPWFCRFGGGAARPQLASGSQGGVQHWTRAASRASWPRATPSWGKCVARPSGMAGADAQLLRPVPRTG